MSRIYLLPVIMKPCLKLWCTHHKLQRPRSRLFKKRLICWSMINWITALQPNTGDNIKQVNITKIAPKATTRTCVHIQKHLLALIPSHMHFWPWGRGTARSSPNLLFFLSSPSVYDWHFSYVYITSLMLNNHCCYFIKRSPINLFYNWYRPF